MAHGHRQAERRIVLVGAAGFGRETLDVIEDVSAAGAVLYKVVGVVDRGPSEASLTRLRERGVSYRGGDDDWLHDPDAEYFAVGIGDPNIRQAVSERYLAAGLSPITLVHPSAIVGRQTNLAPGVIICAGAVVSTNVRIGAFGTINPNATIGHDAQLGDYVSVNPGATISGEVIVGNRTLIGAGAVVLENRVVGADCVVGASSCVTRNVADGSVVKGIPAR